MLWRKFAPKKKKKGGGSKKHNLSAKAAFSESHPALKDPSVLLGRELFFSRVLSGDNDAACASCHDRMDIFAMAVIGWASSKFSWCCTNIDTFRHFNNPTGAATSNRAVSYCCCCLEVTQLP